MTLTIIIICITAVISFTAFSNAKLMDDLIFSPPAVTYRNQWYRFITCGFIHADMLHLLFNMYALYLFGSSIEADFMRIFGEMPGKLLYLGLYITSLVISLLPTYAQHKENYGYRSLGASGAVSAIAFCAMFLSPRSGIGLIFVPFITIPAFIFAPLFLIVSSVLAKKGHGNINHSAHLWGAIYGIAFLIVTSLVLTDFNPITYFVEQVRDFF
ncbi:rhomboid family intramembrane serine protease [Filimonas effusa]|uniref:Rhomboid family intramembrane serine protease n=1 Tax=Filimonas effusa TaxID=2508721 RepID=A0A4Q1DDV6_9BACT|nr:rhomboid family intramembrane serine protease [Filimonas effusa]RXK87158.1 rhomboid family intramembrane serine protease [Filimonas effusa]